MDNESKIQEMKDIVLNFAKERARSIHIKMPGITKLK